MDPQRRASDAPHLDPAGWDAAVALAAVLVLMAGPALALPLVVGFTVVVVARWARSARRD